MTKQRDEVDLVRSGGAPEEEKGHPSGTVSGSYSYLWCHGNGLSARYRRLTFSMRQASVACRISNGSEI